MIAEMPSTVNRGQSHHRHDTADLRYARAMKPTIFSCGTGIALADNQGGCRSHGRMRGDGTFCTRVLSGLHVPCYWRRQPVRRGLCGRRSASVPDGWSATAVIRLDPGEEMTRAADDVVSPRCCRGSSGNSCFQVLLPVHGLG